jgi:hypothetical protein
MRAFSYLREAKKLSASLPSEVVDEAVPLVAPLRFRFAEMYTIPLVALLPPPRHPTRSPDAF